LIYRLTGLGAVALGLVAVIPYILERFFSVSKNIGLGGTSLLIVVGVILETVKQVEAKLVNLDYERFI
jgi:preprotein translocase subunit SecY